MIEASIDAKPAMALSLEISDGSTLPFECIPCIYYPLHFKKDWTKVWTLLDSNDKVNAMISAYIASLGLKIWPTDIEAQKVDDFTL